MFFIKQTFLKKKKLELGLRLRLLLLIIIIIITTTTTIRLDPLFSSSVSGVLGWGTYCIVGCGCIQCTLLKHALRGGEDNCRSDCASAPPF